MTIKKKMRCRASCSPPQNSPVFPFIVRINSKALTLTYQSLLDLSHPTALHSGHPTAAVGISPLSLCLPFLEPSSFLAAFAFDVSSACKTHLPGSYMTFTLIFFRSSWFPSKCSQHERFFLPSVYSVPPLLSTTCPC